jgi:Galactose oxidase, central domain
MADAARIEPQQHGNEDGSVDPSWNIEEHSIISNNGNDTSSDTDDDAVTTESWSPMQPPTLLRTNCGMVAWKRDYLIIVGGTNMETRQCSDSVEMYEVNNNNPWKALPTLNIARRHCACCIVNERYLYVLGGNSNENGRFVDLESVERLDLERPIAFELVEDLPIPLRNATAFVWENQIYLIGGYSSRLENGTTYTTTNIKKKKNSNNEKSSTGGYLATIQQYHANGAATVVAQLPAGPRRLPAVFVLPQHRTLVIVGGYHPELGWTTDGCIFHLDDWSLAPSTTVNSNAAGVGGAAVPNLPIHGDAIFAYWTIGNQCHLISHRTYIMWEYGTSKWQQERADHVRGTRGLAMPNAIVSYEAEDWWYLDRPNSLGNLSIDSIQVQIETCQLILDRASTAGFWELQLLDEAAAAASRLPMLQELNGMLERIDQLERCKHSLVEKFTTLQQSRKFQECSSIAWSIRDIESALEEAYENLWSQNETLNVMDDADPQQQAQRRRFSVHLGGQLKRLSSSSKPHRTKSPVMVNKETLVRKSEDFQTPSRRKSSLLVERMLSKQDLKQLVLSSDRSKTGGVY